MSEPRGLNRDAIKAIQDGLAMVGLEGGSYEAWLRQLAHEIIDELEKPTPGIPGMLDSLVDLIARERTARILGAESHSSPMLLVTQEDGGAFNGRLLFEAEVLHLAPRETMVLLQLARAAPNLLAAKETARRVKAGFPEVTITEEHVKETLRKLRECSPACRRLLRSKSGQSGGTGFDQLVEVHSSR